ncbi:MAG: DUF3574 domain-containing protein [Chloroflexi bacterium AL-W]|nr:DUF3574 domain-containing protein [Chloroflexi bacterium AL-N1]NOK67335.1 DUF3574 domain-containing protein [Chloroflexi bacterium AL-N10]NOK75173.1 DUF3574 domain-containing protein [Chloroflexi bacterium AL-N5]NOK81961.1 DUF3574 domain-containing protein [Chloroflexi bacterium AL-W]NOK89806.1 DUF3574 domain-containing protein [Chloroflexi bacterium AL-N15]
MNTQLSRWAGTHGTIIRIAALMMVYIGLSSAMPHNTSTPALAHAGSPETAMLLGQTTDDREWPVVVGSVWAKTELYFGTLRPDGSEIPKEEFDQFLDEVITPRFPDGLTLLTGEGQFRNSQGIIIQEQSYLLILLYPREDRMASPEIEEIRDLYEETFQQESVLRVDSFARVSF